MKDMEYSRKEVQLLVRRVKEGDDIAFKELEAVAKPLLISLSNHFSKIHYKFEFEDFYSICLHAMYQACNSYSEENPCFLSYAKAVILRRCWRELEYWNTDMRNIFKVREVAIDKTSDSQDYSSDDMFFNGTEYNNLVSTKSYEQNQTIEDEVFKGEYRHNLETIINECFSKDKATILRMYIFQDKSPKDISVVTGTHYKNTYSTIQRGIKKIKEEYEERFLDNVNVL